MELTLEEISDSISETFELDIPDDSMVINVKLNLEIQEGETIDDQWQELPVYDLCNYINDLGCKILFSSAGYHINGNHKIPHLHYNFITTSFKIPSNPSQHRSRWFNKNQNVNQDFLKCSFKFHQQIDKKNPKYSVLSYPLKEGIIVKDVHKKMYIYDGKPMTKEQIKYLVDTGNAIYQKELGLKIRQDKCEERKKVALADLAKLCSEHSTEFKTYKEMVIWLDINYIAKLSLEEYPDPKNYKTNCQKIAINLGKLKYSDIL